MRASVASLLVSVAFLPTGCGSSDRTSQVAERDLTTTQLASPGRQVASPVELNRVTIPPVAPPAVAEEPEDGAELLPVAEEALAPGLNFVVTGEFTPAAAPARRPGIVGAAPGETVRIIATNFATRTGDQEADMASASGDRFVVRIGGGSCQPRGVGGVLF